MCRASAQEDELIFEVDRLGDLDKANGMFVMTTVRITYVNMGFSYLYRYL